MLRAMRLLNPSCFVLRASCGRQVMLLAPPVIALMASEVLRRMLFSTSRVDLLRRAVMPATDQSAGAYSCPKAPAILLRSRRRQRNLAISGKYIGPIAIWMLKASKIALGESPAVLRASVHSVSQARLRASSCKGLAPSSCQRLASRCSTLSPGSSARRLMRVFTSSVAESP